MLFRELDGFDENLKSGEDYDLCERASSLGCKIWIDTELVAYHHGYPETIGGFFRRERWHGMGDVTSISKVAHSKVAIAALLFGLLHLALITSLFFGLAETMVSFGSIFCLCVLVIIYKFNLCSPTLILKLVPAVYFYLLGRLFAFAPINR